MSVDHPFPVEFLPTIIRNAVFEVEKQTQAPLPLIAASVLGAISLVCQNSVDVCRLDNLRSPISLFLLTLAESGERKSTVDKLLMKPLYQLEEELFEQYSKEVVFWRNDEMIFNAEKKALLSRVKSDVSRGRDMSVTSERLKELLASSPVEPCRYKFMFNDATPAAIKNFLSGQWRSIGLMSDEAGVVFNGHSLKELPFINKMWDGSIFSVERKCEPEFLISDARLTLSLMVQPYVFEDYRSRKGDMAKGIGFFARCLICQPQSTQGYRPISNPVVSTEHLPVFHKRLMQLAREGIARKGEKERVCLRFSLEAERKWIDFYNLTEQEMRELGYLSDFKDYASKMAENMARIAALLHYFDGAEGDISAQAVEDAKKISAWYVEEYKRLFTVSKGFTIVDTEAEELYSWIKNHCKNTLSAHISKTMILQYGPHRFRNKFKMNELLGVLYDQNKIIVDQTTKVTYIKPCGFYN